MKKKFEQLKPFYPDELFVPRLNELGNLIKTLKFELKNCVAGKIRVIKKRKVFQFYHIVKKGDKQGTYLPRSRDDFAKKLINQEYKTKILKSALQEQKLLLKVSEFYKSKDLTAVFKKFPASKKQLIKPVTLSQEEYAKLWKSVPYTGKHFSETDGDYFTANHERVRSKSEIIIADLLKNAGVPYRYEFPIELSHEGYNIEVHPDFYCLNPRTRQEFCWEHFGMMDNPEYASKAINKIIIYTQNGWLPGKNFILTMESTFSPLQTCTIEKLVAEYLS